MGPETREDFAATEPHRAAAAAPDLATALVFLWCWLSPTAWRQTLASDLGLIMLMEFFALHSAMFFGGAASAQRESASVRFVTVIVVTAFYLPVAGAFSYFHGGWWPFLAFAWLLSSRAILLLAGRGSGDFESKRQRFYWGAAVGHYIVFAFVAFMLPLPQLGFRNATGVFWDLWWAVKPHEVIAWGFLYFTAMAVTKLVEKREWIESNGEPI